MDTSEGLCVVVGNSGSLMLYRVPQMGQEHKRADQTEHWGYGTGWNTSILSLASTYCLYMHFDYTHTH